MSTSTTPFGDRLSRRSKYEVLVSKYEAAAEVVRTHADTDVQLQPHDQPIAEEEPQQLQPGAGEIEPEDVSTPAPRGARMSVGGTPALLPLSPGSLVRRGSVVPGGSASSGAAPGEDILQRGMLRNGDERGDAEIRNGSQGPEDEEARGGVGGGGLTAGISGALGGLASLAGLRSSMTCGGPFAAVAGDKLGEDGVQLATRPHRKHRSEKPKKAQLTATNWLKVDFKGVDTIIRVDKHKLMHKLGVQARDLRLLDLTSATPPAILDRDKAIIVNLWHIKAIITLDYCLVMSPDAIVASHEREAMARFVSELKAKLASDRKARSYVGLASAASQVTANAGYGSLQLPFELKVLEVCLDVTASQLDDATKVLEADAYPNLDALTQKVSAHSLEKARRIKNQLVRLTKSVESVREVLERFLNDDGDMHRLHLTGAELSRQVSMRPGDLGRLSAGLTPGGAGSVADSDSSSDSSIDEAETAAVEMLLEAYFMQFDHTFNRLQTVHEYIKDTEDLVTIQLDQHRNQLITLDLMLTSFTTGLSLMTVVGGYFGMNLDSGLQEKPHLFKAVVLTTSLVSLSLFVGFLVFMYRQKLLYF